MDVVLTFFGWIFLAAGVLATFVAFAWTLFLAFGTSLLWGLGYLFVPFAGLAFILVHWERAKKPFYLSCVSAVVMVVGIFLLGVGTDSSPLDSVVDEWSEESWDDEWSEEETSSDQWSDERWSDERWSEERWSEDGPTDGNARAGLAASRPREDWQPPTPSDEPPEATRPPLPSRVDGESADLLLGEKVRLVKRSGNRFEGRLEHVDERAVEIAMFSGAGQMKVTVRLDDIEFIEPLGRRR